MNVRYNGCNGRLICREARSIIGGVATDQLLVVREGVCKVGITRGIVAVVDDGYFSTWWLEVMMRVCGLWVEGLWVVGGMVSCFCALQGIVVDVV